jgi:hypothetical protein
VLGFASVVLEAAVFRPPNAYPSANLSASPARVVPNATNQYNIGFRCAFDGMQ